MIVVWLHRSQGRGGLFDQMNQMPSTAIPKPIQAYGAIVYFLLNAFSAIPE
jgi:hypothetical protein